MPASQQPNFAHELRNLIVYDSNTGAMDWKTGGPVGWLSNGYLKFERDGVRCCCREVAWFLQFGAWPHLPVHSNNGNPADLRIRNLRLGTKIDALTGNSKRLSQLAKIQDPAEYARQRAAYAASARTKPAHPLAQPQPAADPSEDEQLW
jgi:hypothetical protein